MAAKELISPRSVFASNAERTLASDIPALHPLPR